MFSPDAELTPGQTADVLNVSRAHLDRLLEQGDIPARNRGGQCRLRARCLDALTAQAQDLDMGY